MKRFTSFLLSLCMIIGMVPAYAADVSIAISNQPKIDVVLTLGQTDKITGLNLDNFDTDLKNKLKGLGVEVDKIVKINKIETSEKNVADSFSWNTTKYANSSIGTISVANGGKNITMIGNSSLPGKNAIFTMPLEDKQQQFKYQYSIDFGDSFNAAGMLLRVKEEGDVISGYMLSFNYSQCSFYRTANAAGGIWKFRMTKNSNSASFTGYPSYNGGYKKPSVDANNTPTEDGIVLVQALPIATSGTLDITVDSKNIKVSGGGLSSPVNVPVDSNTGCGFGFFSDHYSHGCNNIGRFTLTGIALTETSVKHFTDVLSKDVPQWNENSIRAIVNVNQDKEADFADPSKLADILSRCKNQNINYVAWGPSSIESDSKSFIAKNDGNGLYQTLNSSSEYNTAITKTAEYIKSLLPAQTSQGQNYVLVDEFVNINVNPANLKTSTTTDYPSGRWRIVHDPNGVEQSNGQWAQSGAYGKLEVESFNKVGKYDVYFEKDLIKSIIIHRKPVAIFSMVNNGSSVTTTSSSYDSDSYSTNIGYGPGIEEEEWKWKESTETTWHNGKLSSAAAGKSYIVQLRVKDYQETWSDPVTKYISGSSAAVPPVADFSFSNPQISKYATGFTITNASYDPKNVAITQYTWTVVKDGTQQVFNGVGASSFSPPSINFLTYGKGTYAYTLKVKNASGLESEPYTRYLVVVDDVTEPEIATDIQECDWTNTVTVGITLSDKDSKLNSWGYQFTTSATPPASITLTSVTGATATKSAKLDKQSSVAKEYYLHVWAKDNANNLAKIVRGPYKMDGQAPVIAITPNSIDWHKENFDVFMKVTDGQKLGDISYTITNSTTGHTDSGNITGTDTEKSKTVTLDTDGLYQIAISAIDAGKNTASSTVNLRLDTTLPGVSTSIDEADWIDSVVIDTTLTDEGSKLKTWGYKFTDSETVPASMTMNPIAGTDVAEREQTVTIGKANGTGIYYLHIWVEDNAGNLNKIVKGPYKIDGEAPVVSITPDSYDWHREDFDVILTATDNQKLEDVSYIVENTTTDDVDTGDIEGDDNEKTATKTLSEDGIYKITIEAADAGQNSSSLIKTVRLDKTSPEFEEDSHSFFVSGQEVGNITGEHAHVKEMVTIVLNVSDTLSGIDYFTYKVKNKPSPELKTVTPTTGECSFTLHQDIDGEIAPTDEIEIIVYDNAGNSSTLVINDLVLDNTPPEIVVDENGIPEWITSTTKEALEEEGKETIDIMTQLSDAIQIDHLGSAWKSIFGEDEDETWGDTPTETESSPIDPNSIEHGEVADDGSLSIDPDAYTRDGTYLVHVKSWDHTFNVETYLFDLHVDKTKPKITVNEPTGWHTEPINFDIEVSDNLSGLRSLTIYTEYGVLLDEFDLTGMDEENIQFVLGRDTNEFDGDYNIYFTLLDAAGNSTTILRNVKLDQQTHWSAPYIEFTNEDGLYYPGEWSTTDVRSEYAYSADDIPVSGFKTYIYKVDGESHTTDVDNYTFSQDGIYKFAVAAISNAGLVSDYTTPVMSISEEAGETEPIETDNYIIRLDKTRPSVDGIYLRSGNRLGNNTYFNRTVYLSTTGEDNLSGIEGYQYRTGSSDTWFDMEGNLLTMKHMDEEGNHTEFSDDLIFRTIDKAGNISREFTVENFNIDITPPTLVFDHCERNMIVMRASEPITKNLEGFIRFKDEKGNAIRNMYMHNNKIKAEGDLLYIDISQMVVADTYTVTFDPGIVSDRAGNKNKEYTERFYVYTDIQPRFIGATAAVDDGRFIEANLSENSWNYQVVIPMDIDDFTLEPHYSSDIKGILTSSYGEFVNGRLPLKASQISSGTVIDITLGEETNYVVIYKTNYTFKKNLNESLGASVVDGQFKGAVDVTSDILNGAQEITVTLKIFPGDEDALMSDTAIALSQITDDEIISGPIRAEIIKDCDGDVSPVYFLQADPEIILGMPAGFENRQYYKIIRVFDGDVITLNARSSDSFIAFNSGLYYSTLYIVAGPEFEYEEDIKNEEIIRPSNRHKVRFDTDGGSLVSSQNVKHNDTLDMVDTPIKSGYRFIGWYTDKNLIREFDFDTKIRRDMVLYAKWEYVGPTQYFVTEHVGYISGFGDGTIQPERNISRAEVVVMLYRLLNRETIDAYYQNNSSFIDVANNDWDTEAIATLTNMGIVRGRGNGVFDPNANITRAEFAVIASRLDSLPENMWSSQFIDVAEDYWAFNEINSAATKGWIRGYGNRRFGPENYMTRAETVAIINRVLNRDKLTFDGTLPNMITFSDNMDDSAWYYLDIQEAANGHEHRFVNDTEKWKSLYE